MLVGALEKPRGDISEGLEVHSTTWAGWMRGLGDNDPFFGGRLRQV